LEVLPSVVDNWAELSIDEKQRMSSLNNSFCGFLHLLVGTADTASSTLLQWELAHFENSIGTETPFLVAIKNLNLVSYVLLE